MAWQSLSLSLSASNTLADVVHDLICLYCYSKQHTCWLVFNLFTRTPRSLSARLLPRHTDPACIGLFGYDIPGAEPYTLSIFHPYHSPATQFVSCQFVQDKAMGSSVEHFAEVQVNNIHALLQIRLIRHNLPLVHQCCLFSITQVIRFGIIFISTL